ncbi:MAG TPA: hypothetical protein VKA13_06960 [Gammaproteobacteria bacterium]|nr:hypothetical protein [Gammaproteobacteria bacterium]
MKHSQGFSTVFSAGALLRAATVSALAAGLALAAPAQAAGPTTAQGAAHPPMQAPHRGVNPQAMSPAQKKQFEEFQKARQDLVQARNKLNKIQAETLKKHPELKKQRKAFGDLLAKTMKKNGYDAKKSIAELKSLRDKLKDDKTPKDKRRKLAQDFQTKVIALRKAQGQAMQDKKVKKAREDLGQAVIAAMKKQDPSTDDLIATVQKRQQELIKIRRSIMEHAKQDQARQGK